MSSEYAIRQRALESGAATPRAAGPRAGASDVRSLHRALRVVLVALCTGCTLVLFARFVASPLMTIRHVVVHSDVPLAESQVLSLSGLQGDERYYALPVDLLRRRLEASPLVRRAVVQKVFPDTVRMTVWGRQPAALLLAQSDGKMLPVLVDGEGVLFRVGETGSDLDVPVISGIPIGSSRIGERLPQAYAGLLADLKVLRDRDPALFRLISELKVVPAADAASVPGTEASAPAAAPASTSDPAAPSAQDEADSPAGFDVQLYLTTSPVPVLMHGDIDESLVKYTLMVTDLLSKQGVLKDIQALDFRSGNVVYRMKERPSPLVGR
ncbi:MAG TPA: FtsQ-type POTRA domain-containing protein [Spirochaetia bacterium]|nr:FtsQ-type POTRA domain-containing protein [Spirochaetia bacterium]